MPPHTSTPPPSLAAACRRRRPRTVKREGAVEHEHSGGRRRAAEGGGGWGGVRGGVRDGWVVVITGRQHLHGGEVRRGRHLQLLEHHDVHEELCTAAAEGVRG